MMEVMPRHDVPLRLLDCFGFVAPPTVTAGGCCDLVDCEADLDVFLGIGLGGSEFWMMGAELRKTDGDGMVIASM